MKSLMLSLSLFSFGAVATPAGDLSLNASSLKLKVYKMAVSTSANCSSPVTVINNGSTPVEVDVKGTNPVFGAGTIADGTYPCVMFLISDTIKYKGQASASGNCSPSVEVSRDLCRLDNSGTTQLLDGSTFNCTNSEDQVVIYLSTNTTSNPSGNGFAPPASAGSQDGSQLGAALTVSGSAIGKMMVNTNGYLCDNQNDTGSDCDGAGSEAASSAACRLEGADFTFSKL
jgi:hypothetical protein